jgi:hypothetical protein
MKSQDQLPVHDTRKRPRELKVGCKPLKSPGVEVPYLLLRGRWLRDAGFDIGQSVKVAVSEGRLTIEACAVTRVAACAAPVD